MSSADAQQRVKELFSEAVERPADQRDSFLQAACGGDTDLRAHVQRLLAALDGEPDFLESPPPTTDLRPSTTDLLTNGEADLVGEQVSRYHPACASGWGAQGATQHKHNTWEVKDEHRVPL